MDFSDFDKFIVFIVFFVPGFISIKIYDLLVIGDRRDFSKSILEAIGYSCLYYATLSWLILLIHSNNFFSNHTVFYVIVIFIILFLFPILWPILFIKLITCSKFLKYFNNPIPKPWDYVFLKREPYWVIIHLKDGKRIGGIYNTDSYASVYPIEEQIYLQEVWKLDEMGIRKMIKNR